MENKKETLKAMSRINLRLERREYVLRDPGLEEDSRMKIIIIMSRQNITKHCRVISNQQN